jgi:hypothetical protein
MTYATIEARSERISPRYFGEISKFPMLSLQEEMELACRWRDQ